LVAAAVFYLVAHDQILYRDVLISVEPTEWKTPVGEITTSVLIEQPLQVGAEQLRSLSVLSGTYDRTNAGLVSIELLDQGNDQVYAHWTFDAAMIPNNDSLILPLMEPIDQANEKNITLRVKSDSKSGEAITFWQRPVYGGLEPLRLNGVSQDTVLVYTTRGVSESRFGKYYLPLAGILTVLLIGYCFMSIYKERRGRISLLMRITNIFERYGFLIHQLVSRDFKTKYKRSVLGIIWSFLNPLLMMSVQYVVFSTLFKSNIANFPVYLLTGIVFFSFFNEASSMSLLSIVGNTALITKVYMPKYIYPVSRVLSSSINLGLSLLPLILVILLTGTRITPAFILLPYGILCLIVFSMGIGMALSSSMVFFRDTQFLWNVVSMLWMYATPIFYPESIIPPHFSFLLRFNPLYHFIRFSRTIVLTGVSPDPSAYFYCTAFAVGMLLFGAFVFKKTQDRFILHI